MPRLLIPAEVDVMLRYPSNRTARLIRQGKMPFVTLPDGEIRVDLDQLEKMLADAATNTLQVPAGRTVMA